MIAYNYTIQFIPPLSGDNDIVDLSLEHVTIREDSAIDFDKTSHAYLTFSNNQGRKIRLYSDRDFTFREQGQLWVFEIADVVTFFWYSGSLNLEYHKEDKFTEELLKYWALHIVLPIFFTVEERYDFLHSGAVEIDEKPILFVAESFGGKSTMTDFFMKQGQAMLSDDKVAVYEEDGAFFSVPSHPHHRPHRGMEDLGIFVENVAKEPKPIHAIYELEKSDANAKVDIIELSGIEKFKSLRYSSEINLSFLKAKRFIFLSRLAKVVPVYKVTVPWDMKRLGEVYAMIVEHTA